MQLAAAHQALPYFLFWHCAQTHAVVAATLSTGTTASQTSAQFLCASAHLLSKLLGRCLMPAAAHPALSCPLCWPRHTAVLRPHQPEMLLPMLRCGCVGALHEDRELEPTLSLSRLTGSDCLCSAALFCADAGFCLCFTVGFQVPCIRCPRLLPCVGAIGQQQRTDMHSRLWLLAYCILQLCQDMTTCSAKQKLLTRLLSCSCKSVVSWVAWRPKH